MSYYRTILASAAALLLLTCTSCSVDLLDTDGDGRISRSEFWSAVFDSVCGGDSDSDAVKDEPSTDEPSTDQPSTDQPSTDGSNTDDPTTDDQTANGGQGGRTGR